MSGNRPWYSSTSTTPCSRPPARWRKASRARRPRWTCRVSQTASWTRSSTRSSRGCSPPPTSFRSPRAAWRHTAASCFPSPKAQSARMGRHAPPRRVTRSKLARANGRGSPERSGATAGTVRGHAGDRRGTRLLTRGWVVEEEGLRHYVVIKHNASDDAVLAEVLAGVRSRRMVDGMHVHANGNNLAFLPTGLAKRAAVQEWLRRDREIHGERPVRLRRQHHRSGVHGSLPHVGDTGAQPACVGDGDDPWVIASRA